MPVAFDPYPIYLSIPDFYSSDDYIIRIYFYSTIVYIFQIQYRPCKLRYGDQVVSIGSTGCCNNNGLVCFSLRQNGGFPYRKNVIPCFEFYLCICRVGG